MLVNFLIAYGLYNKQFRRVKSRWARNGITVSAIPLRSLRCRADCGIRHLPIPADGCALCHPRPISCRNSQCHLRKRTHFNCHEHKPRPRLRHHKHRAKLGSSMVGVRKSNVLTHKNATSHTAIVYNHLIVNHRQSRPFTNLHRHFSSSLLMIPSHQSRLRFSE